MLVAKNCVKCGLKFFKNTEGKGGKNKKFCSHRCAIRFWTEQHRLRVREYDRNWKKAWRKRCPEKYKEINKRWRSKNLDWWIKYQREYRRIYLRKHPWVRIYKDIRRRCNNSKRADYKYYGARGIRCLITSKDLEKRWFLDMADKMKWPTIHRLDNDGNYTFRNCRFVEMSENVAARNWKGGRSVFECFRCGKRILKWPSQVINGRVYCKSGRGKCC